MTNKCSLCKAGGESTNLILIYYKKTKKMYDMLLAIPRLRWVFPDSMKELLLGWKVRGIDIR